MVTLSLRYRYVYEDVDRYGNVRVYFRRRKTDRKIRIEEPLGTEAFSKRYNELLLAADAGELQSKKDEVMAGGISPGSFRWLCVEYFRAMVSSGELDKRTIHVRRLVLEKVWDEPLKPGSKDRAGDCPAHLFSPRLVTVLRDRRKDAPETANARVKGIRRVYAWALDPVNEIPGIRVIKTNPARDVAFLRPKKQGGFHTWTEAEVEQYMDCHPLGTKSRLALDILLYTGVRRSDAVLLGRQHLRKGWWRFTTYKGRNTNPVQVEIPCLPVLQTTIDASPCGDLTFIVNAYGRPFTAESFGNWFREQCDQAGLKHCSAHGLRKAGAALAAENGATTNQLMSIFGWLTAKEAERYTKAAERKRLAANAPALLTRSSRDRS